jgi:large conductance mechanosensitive channel
MGMLKEFKTFAMRGNVIDMAVGIIIGGAFGAVVKSLVDNVVMPPIGWLTGGVDFKSLSWTIKEPVTKMVDGVSKVEVPAVTIDYGLFINNVVTFVIVAWSVFLLVKMVNTAERKLWREDEKPADAPPPPEDIRLLREIRDALVKAN